MRCSGLEAPETDSKEEFERIKKQCEAGMTYYRTALRRFTREQYMEHIYTNDKIIVHLYDISFRDDDKPYYEIEIRSVYAGADHYHWRDYDYMD